MKITSAQQLAPIERVQPVAKVQAETTSREPATRRGPHAPSDAPLASETLGGLIEHGQQVGALEKVRHGPAWAARDAIAENPHLAELPFGRVVSLLARGLALPEPPAAEPVVEAPSETPPVDQVVETPPVEDLIVPPPTDDVVETVETPVVDLVDLLEPILPEPEDQPA